MDVKELVNTIRKRYLKAEDLQDLVSLKAIGKTKKEWTCCKCNQKIKIGSSAARSFRKHSDWEFEKLYWCVDCLHKLDKILEQSEMENHYEDALDAIGFDHLLECGTKD